MEKERSQNLPIATATQATTKTPKRFFKSQIPDSITANPALSAAISVLPSNYNFEVHKCIWRILASGAKRVALQLPEGLLMYSLVLCDIFQTFASVEECFVLGDVTYGACCVDDFSAAALDADLLIHYGHSCLVPIDAVKIPSLYVFVEISIDVEHLVETVQLNFDPAKGRIALAGTIQFSAAVRAAKSALSDAGFHVVVPQSRPLSAGEVLGCTSPSIPKNMADVVVFVADGRFHLEAFMIANPGIRAFRYDPYLKVLFLEEYDHDGMKEARKNAILKARDAERWGIVLGTLGRQGNPKILDRLQKGMVERGFHWTVVLMSEISPARISLFEDSIDAWIQIACPRLSIDWGEAFGKPLLTPFEAEIALGFIKGWWEKGPEIKSSMNSKCGDVVKADGLDRKQVKSSMNSKCGDVVKADGLDRKQVSCSNCNCVEGSNVDDKTRTNATDYPMDYYAQDGGEWNCSYVKKSLPPRKPRLHKG